MKPIRVLLADDHALVRVGIRTLLSGYEDIQVVAEAEDGEQALRLIKTHRPDVALLDIGMPNLNGLDALAQIVKDFPEVRVIILTMHATEGYILRALRAGAAGYLVKGSSMIELESAIRAVSRGETFLSSAVSKQVVDVLKRQHIVDAPSPPGRRVDLERLTPRQQEVLRMIADGNTTKEIAQKLKISVKTVKTHRTLLMEILDIHDVAGLVRYALRVGLIVQDE